MKILAVEDSPSARRLMQGIFFRLGLELPDFRLATDAAEGKAVFEAWHPDLVFLDIELTRSGGYAGGVVSEGESGSTEAMNGDELGRVFLRSDPNVRLVLVTAHDPEYPPVQTLLKEGASEVIVKPVLAAKVSEVIERVRLEARRGTPRRPSASAPAGRGHRPTGGPRPPRR